MSDTSKAGKEVGAGQSAATADMPVHAGAPKPVPAAPVVPVKVPEIGGPKGPEPTRYGDWERKGICVDF